MKKYVGKVLTIVYDIFMLGCAVFTVCVYFEDIKDVIKYWFE